MKLSRPVSVVVTLLLLLVSIHIWRVRKDGGIYIPNEERGLRTLTPRDDDAAPLAAAEE